MTGIFQTAGPLPPYSPVYVRRTADEEIWRHLLVTNYIQLTEPRQVGKTSLIYRLRDQLAPNSYTLTYIDAESLCRESEAGWYQDLCSRLVPQLADLVEGELLLPCDYYGFREFLRDIAMQITTRSRRLAIALDEIGSVPEHFSEGFFRVLREIFTVREIEPCFKNLTFILSGAFDPRDLIKDPRISPFNVAERVTLTDFSRSQVRQLVDFLRVAQGLADIITDRVCYWTGGQPYLTQWICALLERGLPLTREGVDQAAEKVWREDTNHLPRIFEELERDQKAREYLKRLEGEAIRFAPAANRLQAKLALIGIIKAEEQGYCTVRNRIYEEALRSYLEGEEMVMPHGRDGVIDNLRVFISSTITDLGPEREAVKEAISELYLNPVFAEGFGARLGTPREECLSQVHKSDLFIGLFWQRYGYITDRDISASEEEYQEARASNKPILIYIKRPAPDREMLLTRFLRNLQSYGTGHFLTTFTTAGELREQVKLDVMRAVSQLARGGRKPPLTQRGQEAQTTGVHIQAQAVHIHGDVTGRDTIRRRNRTEGK